MRMLVPLLPCLLAATAASADDWLEQLSFVDIRLGVGTTPVPDSYDVKVSIYPDWGGGSVSYTDEVDQDRATTFTYGIIGGRLDPVGMLVGVEMVYANARMQLERRTSNGTPVVIPDAPAAFNYDSLGGNALLGVGWSLSSRLHLEALGVLGGGAARSNFVDSPASNEARGHGTYWIAGIRAGAYYTWRKLVLGALVEYTYMELDASKDWLDATTRTDTDAAGVGGRIEIGYHIQ